MTKTFVVVDEMMHQSYPMIMQYVKTEYKEALESFFKDRKEKLTDYLEKYTTPLEIIIDFEREDASILFFSLENSVIREKLISFFGKWIETEGQRILEQQDLSVSICLEACKGQLPLTRSLTLSPPTSHTGGTDAVRTRSQAFPQL